MTDQEPTVHPDVTRPSNFEDDVDFILRLFARAEMESLTRPRMAVRDLKDRSSKYTRRACVFDIEDDIERALALTECLPQGSRGTEPPREEFLELAKEAVGNEAKPEHILYCALLLEEHALELLAPHLPQNDNSSNGQPESPWATLSPGKTKRDKHYENGLSRRDKWTIRLMRKLLGSISAAEEEGEGRSSENMGSGDARWAERQKASQRAKRRRRQTPEHVSQQDSDSSDYYGSVTTSSDEDGALAIDDGTDGDR